MCTVYIWYVPACGCILFDWQDQNEASRYPPTVPLSFQRLPDLLETDKSDKSLLLLPRVGGGWWLFLIYISFFSSSPYYTCDCYWCCCFSLTSYACLCCCHRCVHCWCGCRWHCFCCSCSVLLQEFYNCPFLVTLLFFARLHFFAVLVLDEVVFMFFISTKAEMFKSGDLVGSPQVPKSSCPPAACWKCSSAQPPPIWKNVLALQRFIQPQKNLAYVAILFYLLNSKMESFAGLAWNYIVEMIVKVNEKMIPCHLFPRKV